MGHGSSLDRILPVQSPGNDVPHLFEFGSVHQRPEFSHTIIPAHQNNVVDTFRALERFKRVNDDRLTCQESEELVEAHSLAAAGGDNDGG